MLSAFWTLAVRALGTRNAQPDGMGHSMRTSARIPANASPARFSRQYRLGEFCWGITASDGPGELLRSLNGRERRFFDYLARGVPYGPDDGTIAPWAVVASLRFAPEIVLPTLDYFNGLLRAAGFTGAWLSHSVPQGASM